MKEKRYNLLYISIHNRVIMISEFKFIQYHKYNVFRGTRQTFIFLSNNIACLSSSRISSIIVIFVSLACFIYDVSVFHLGGGLESAGAAAVMIDTLTRSIY